MKHKHIAPIVASLILAITCCLPSCKTSEKNYRKAYEATMAANDSTDRDFDRTIYGRYRQQLRRTPMLVGGDTLDLRKQSIRITDGGGGTKESIKAYMLVAGEFKQLFNARSMRERLAAAGYTEAFVVETGEPYYYVIAAAYTTPEDALVALKKLRANPPFRLRGDLPFVLTPTSLPR